MTRDEWIRRLLDDVSVQIYALQMELTKLGAMAEAFRVRDAINRTEKAIAHRAGQWLDQVTPPKNGQPGLPQQPKVANDRDAKAAR